VIGVWIDPPLCVSVFELRLSNGVVEVLAVRVVSRGGKSCGRVTWRSEQRSVACRVGFESFNVCFPAGFSISTLLQFPVADLHQVYTRYENQLQIYRYKHAQSTAPQLALSLRTVFRHCFRSLCHNVVFHRRRPSKYTPLLAPLRYTLPPSSLVYALIWCPIASGFCHNMMMIH
jgi:hypothetical protein